MSLINEALKKAQGDRPAQGPANPAAANNPPEAGHYTPPKKGNRKSFVWGFILAVFIVGAFTIMLSTYFVMQILGAEKSGGEAAPETAAQPIEPVLLADAETDMNATPQPGPSVAQTAPVEQVKSPKQTGIDESTEPVQPAMPPDPAVMARLMELEIRGIMSGGTRVLIFDQVSGRNKAYRTGDSLEGTMGLIVENISNSSIKFKDYAGQIHTKSF